MNSKLLSRLGKYTSVGFIGYITGSFVEKWKLFGVSQKDALPHWPGLPVFGTVSAATSFVPDTQVAIPGGEVTYSKPTRIAQVSLMEVWKYTCIFKPTKFVFLSQAFIFILMIA